MSTPGTIAADSAAAGSGPPARGLYRRAGAVGIATEHATVARPGAQGVAAAGTGPEEHAGVIGHDLRVAMAAVRTGEGGGRLDHAYSLALQTLDSTAQREA